MVLCINHTLLPQKKGGGAAGTNKPRDEGGHLQTRKKGSAWRMGAPIVILVEPTQRPTPNTIKHASSRVERYAETRRMMREIGAFSR